MALAVAIFEFFWARSRTAMAALRDGMISSRPVGRWDSISMVKTRGSDATGRAVEERVPS